MFVLHLEDILYYFGAIPAFTLSILVTNFCKFV